MVHAFLILLLPYVIAEIGVNHEGSIDQARHLIDLAKAGGADAAKFQSYKADTLASKILLPIGIPLKSQPNQHELLVNMITLILTTMFCVWHCRQVGIDFVSTPFDLRPLISLTL